MKPKYIRVASKFKDTSEVPKARELFYRCLACDAVVPSMPRDNISCSCNSIYIDADLQVLFVADCTSFEVVTQKKS